MMRDRIAGKLVVADDERQNRELLKRLMVRLGYEVVTAEDGAQALDAVARERPDVVLLDVDMPALTGIEVCKRLKADMATRLLPVVLITGLTSTADRVQGIEAGADDFLTKPFIIAELEARVRSLIRLKRYTDDLDSAESVIVSLALTIEARDPYTRGHCERLAHYASEFGEFLGLDEGSRIALYRGGFLHDIGKVGIPDAVLLKAGPLTPSEYALMKEHTLIGDRLCAELRSLEDVRPIVRHHHERTNGTGYPDGLALDDIPLLAQIMAVVDAYDAMTTDRPYKAARTQEQAFDELRGEVVKGWKDAALVDHFIAMLLQTDHAQHAIPALVADPLEHWRARPVRSQT
jgi:putative two-component system response regulator